MANTSRTSADIRRDIERSREALATSVDQLVYRTNPKRLLDDAKQAIRERANTPAGRIAMGVAGSLVVVLVVRRVRKR